MALFSFECYTCGIFRLHLAKRTNTADCPKCGTHSKNVIKVGTVSVRERLDNGVMGRAVERPHNIDELMEEHSSIGDQPMPEIDEDEPSDD